jgi:membrane protein
MIEPGTKILRHPIRWLIQSVEALIGLIRRTLERANGMHWVERSVALASSAFTAFVPLLLIIGAVVPGTGGFADSIIRRFQLHGNTATLVQHVFASPNATKQAISIAGILLLVVSALSFTRSLQRMYEQAWKLPVLGVRATPGGLQWLLVIVVWATGFAAIRRAVVDATGPAGAVTIVLVGNTLLWLITPTLLLSRRIPWRRLLPTAVLTAIVMTAISGWSLIYMPHLIAKDTSRYGPIGLALALVSWLVIVGFAIVLCTALGAEISEGNPRTAMSRAMSAALEPADSGEPAQPEVVEPAQSAGVQPKDP